MDKRTRAQRKVFSRWLELFLVDTELEGKEVDIQTDLKDGVILSIAGSKLAKKKFPTRVKASTNKLACIGNLQQVLDFLQAQQVRITLGPQDIYDGKDKLVLGLLWSLMLRFQIDSKKEILRWTQELLNGKFDGFTVNDFSESWVNGIGFCLLVNSFKPRAIPEADLTPSNRLHNFELAFTAAKELLKIPPLLDAADMEDNLVGEREVLTYLSFFYNKRDMLVEPEPEPEPEPEIDYEKEELRRELAETKRELEELRQISAEEVAQLRKMAEEANAASQELIRTSQGKLDDLIGNNEEMKEEMDRVMAENSVISKRLLEFSLKLPLIQQGSMSVVEPPEGLVTLVFTDVQSSTQQWEHTPEAMAESLAKHNDIMREYLLKHSGYEVKTEGDAFMVAFADPVSAMRWCLEIQLQLLKMDWCDEIMTNEASKEEYAEDGTLIYRGLRVRMGVHAGKPSCQIDPTTRRMDYFGPMVNRSARVEGSAKGGQILISGDAFELIKDSLNELGSPSIKDLGEFRLKGLTSDTRLIEVLPKELPRTFPEIVVVSAGEEKKGALKGEVDQLQSQNAELQKALGEMEERAAEEERKALEMQKWLEEQKDKFESSLADELKTAAMQLKKVMKNQEKAKSRLKESQHRNEQLQTSLELMSEMLERSGFREEDLELQVKAFEEERDEITQKMEVLQEEVDWYRSQKKSKGFFKKILGGSDKPKFEAAPDDRAFRKSQSSMSSMSVDHLKERERDKERIARRASFHPGNMKGEEKEKDKEKKERQKRRKSAMVLTRSQSEKIKKNVVRKGDLAISPRSDDEDDEKKLKKKKKTRKSSKSKVEKTKSKEQSTSEQSDSSVTDGAVSPPPEEDAQTTDAKGDEPKLSGTSPPEDAAATPVEAVKESDAKESGPPDAESSAAGDTGGVAERAEDAADPDAQPADGTTAVADGAMDVDEKERAKERDGESALEEGAAVDVSASAVAVEGEEDAAVDAADAVDGEKREDGGL